jgi:hypothetical protein
LVTEGGSVTVSVAAEDVAEPCEFVNTARYSVPDWAIVGELTV